MEQPDNDVELINAEPVDVELVDLCASSTVAKQASDQVALY